MPEIMPEKIMPEIVPEIMPEIVLSFQNKKESDHHHLYEFRCTKNKY